MTEEQSDQPTRAELEALYAECSSELLSFLRGVLRDQDLASEARQLAYVKLIEQGYSARQETLKGWLFKVALNEARGIRRRSQREQELLKRPAWRIEKNPSNPEESLIHQEKIEELRELIKQLPEEQKEIIDLRLREELTFAKIADKLNIPLGTVLTRMRTAMKTLTTQMNDPEL